MGFTTQPINGVRGLSHHVFGSAPLVSETYQNRTSVGAEQILLIRFKGNNENHAIETVTFFAQLIVVNVKVIADG